MTEASAALLKTMDSYTVLDFALTGLEAQKLGYFLQESGLPMDLSFEKAIHGPYCEALNVTLGATDETFADRYSEQTPFTVRPEALKIAEAKLLETEKPALLDATKRVQEVIHGWESPHGLELLSTVHWLAARDNLKTLPELIAGFRNWNDRKSRLFTPDQIACALAHLREYGWLPTPR